MADVTYDINSSASNTVDILGLNDIKADLKLELPQPLKTETSNALEIKPLKADLDTNAHLTIDPLKLELQVDPLKTDSSLSLDMKPAVIDLCLTANVGKLPNVCIRQPYHHHIGFTMFGVEMWGFTVSGQQETVIEELDRRPKVAWGDTTAAWPPAGPLARPRPAPPASAPPPSQQSGGLRIRLGP